MKYYKWKCAYLFLSLIKYIQRPPAFIALLLIVAIAKVRSPTRPFPARGELIRIIIVIPVIVVIVVTAVVIVIVVIGGAMVGAVGGVGGVLGRRDARSDGGWPRGDLALVDARKYVAAGLPRAPHAGQLQVVVKV